MNARYRRSHEWRVMAESSTLRAWRKHHALSDNQNEDAETRFSLTPF